MRFQLFSLGLSLLILTSTTLFSSSRVKAQIPISEYDLVGDDNQSQGILSAPDFNSITLNTLGTFTEAGSITNQFDSIIGYEFGRSWQAGEQVVDVFKLGDLADTFGLDRLSLGEIALKSGQNLAELTLDHYSFLGEHTVAEFIAANPQLQDISIRQIPPLAELVVREYGEDSSVLNFSARHLTSSEGTYSDIAQLTLGKELDLSQYSFEDVPGLENSQLKDYAGWENHRISEIENLSDIPLIDFPNPISTSLGAISRVDAIWGETEGRVEEHQSVSGSNQAGYHVPCTGQCAHIELDDLENSGRDLRIAEGKRWLLGNDPNNGAFCPDAPWGVKGGQGILGVFNCGREPTGRNPLGPAFKVALWNVNEATDEAETAIFFRICKRGIPDLGCTPYFIGPIPWLPAHRDSWIILGFDS
ncbi:MAG: hypothetical protein RLZZ381_2076 [Cyanobacteriota bacterium]|jgi:hypothetical protein